MSTTLQSVCFGEKVVLVTVYVEKPTRRKATASASASLSHNHQLHHSIKQGFTCGKSASPAGRGYNRRAEILHFSRCLRESAPPVSSTPVHPLRQQASKNQQRLKAKIKSKYASAPACLCFWKILIQRNLEENNKNKTKELIGSTTTKIKDALSKSLKVKKKMAFVFKLVSRIQKH